MKHIAEGDQCPDPACSGTMQFRPVENCSCHISPPCFACTTNPLVCSECGEEASQFSDADLYVSDACLSDTHTSLNETLGSYLYSWGSHAGFEPDCALYEDSSYSSFGSTTFPDDFGTLRTSNWINPYNVNWYCDGLKSSSCSMCKVGTFPPYMSHEEVRKQVVGTFGGRFEAFDQDRGTFTYIAFTD